MCIDWLQWRCELRSGVADGPEKPLDQPDQPHKKWDTGGNKVLLMFMVY